MFVQHNESQEAQDTYYMLLAILQTFEFQIGLFIQLLSVLKYEQLVKSKKKEVKLELIRRDDFLGVIRDRMGIDLSQPEGDSIVSLLSGMLQLDSKYQDVYQLKSVQILMDEVLSRHIREEQERKVMEEFYKPTS